MEGDDDDDRKDEDEDFSNGDWGNSDPVGLLNTGVIALRNSVYAGGGVMAVLPPSSDLIGLSWAGAMGRSWSSDGNSMVFGVTRGRSVGLGAILPKEGEGASWLKYICIFVVDEIVAISPKQA